MDGLKLAQTCVLPIYPVGRIHKFHQRRTRRAAPALGYVDLALGFGLACASTPNEVGTRRLKFGDA